MPLRVEKGDRENNQSLMRRFTRRLRDSGILTEAKKSMYRRRGKSEQLKKRAALRRLERRKEIERQRKLGMEEPRRRSRR